MAVRRFSPSSSISHVPRVRDCSFYRGETVGPCTQDVPSRQADGATSQPRGVEVPLAIGLELRIAVPFGTIDFERDAIIDEQILAPESRHIRLGIHLVPCALEPQSCDRLESGTAAVDHAPNSVVKPCGCAIADQRDLRRRKEAQMDRRFECRYRVLFIEATDRLPESLHPACFPWRAHRKLRHFPMKMHPGRDSFGRVRWDLQVQLTRVPRPYPRAAKNCHTGHRPAQARGCRSNLIDMWTRVYPLAQSNQAPRRDGSGEPSATRAHRYQVVSRCDMARHAQPRHRHCHSLDLLHGLWTNSRALPNSLHEKLR
jgi:hypothetical protein